MEYWSRFWWLLVNDTIVDELVSDVSIATCDAL